MGEEFGWSANWVLQVARQSLPVLCTWAGKGLDELSDADLAAFRPVVEAAPHLSESARTRARIRLFAVGQICFQLVCFELGSAIARELARYAETIATVLCPARQRFIRAPTGAT